MATARSGCAGARSARRVLRRRAIFTPSCGVYPTLEIDPGDLRYLTFAVWQVTAPYATPVYADQKLTNPAEGDPRTRMWIMLYAQVMQADGSTSRNVLLGRKFAAPRFDRLQIEDRVRASTRDVIGRAEFPQKSVEAVLAALALPVDSPLSVLAVELLPSGGLKQDVHRLMLPFLDFDEKFAVTSDTPAPAPADPFAGGTATVTDPLGADLGKIRSHRILRASLLTPVPPAC
jgi:hypothetical protein